MHRIQPIESVPSSSSVGATEDSKKEAKSDDRKMETSFSWDMAIEYFERQTAKRMGKAEIYFMEDGMQIKDEEYLARVTSEICREFGFELLNVLTDLILPVGFGYPSLNNGLQELITDAFKPVSKTGYRKTIVWIEDDQWGAQESIAELLVRQLLLEKAEPFLIAPAKYFDKEVMSSVFKMLATDPNEHATTATESETYWQTFSDLLSFGFLLSLRSSTFPLILLHFGQKLGDRVDAFRMLDLAATEGHDVKYIKNPTSGIDKRIIIADFASSLVRSTSPSFKKIRLQQNMD